MIGWSFFFMLVGVSTLASQVFRVVDYIHDLRYNSQETSGNNPITEKRFFSCTASATITAKAHIPRFFRL